MRPERHLGTLESLNLEHLIYDWTTFRASDSYVCLDCSRLHDLVVRVASVLA